MFCVLLGKILDKQAEFVWFKKRNENKKGNLSEMPLILSKMLGQVPAGTSLCTKSKSHNVLEIWPCYT